MNAAPHYPGLPLLGSILEAREDPLSMFERAAQLGDVVEMSFPTRQVFLVSSPKLAERVLHDNHTAYGKQTHGYDALRAILGNGLVTSEGTFWLRQRRLAQPAFHRERIAGWGEVMVRATRELCSAWEQRLQRHAPFDVHQEMMRLTLRIVGEALLSTDVTGAAAEVGEALTEVLRLATKKTAQLVPLPGWVPTPEGLRIKRRRAQLDDVVRGIIAERRAGNSRHDLLGMFMDMQDADTGERMDDRQLADEVMTVLLAGHETTATALSWAFWLLGRAPHVERKLRAELDEVLAGREPTAADAPKLPYTAAVLHETMRLYPPVWMLARSASEDDVLGGVHIPKGAYVMVSPWIVHRQAELWPDPEAFDPERWMNSPKPPARCAYLPFSSGPRKCIGDGFAQLEGQLVLATLLQRMHLSLVPGHRVEPEPVFTLRPKGGVWVTAAPVLGKMAA